MTSDRPPPRLRLRSRSLEWRATGEEVVVLDLDRSEYLLVNRSGAELWRRLVDGASLVELAAHLIERYGLPPADAEADVRRFMATLDERRLVETV